MLHDPAPTSSSTRSRAARAWSGQVRRPGRGRRVIGGVLSATLVALGLVGVPAAVADGTPNVAVAVTAPAQALLGGTFPVTISATNPAGPNGYNASFRLVLPAGATLDSATPAPTTTVVRADGTTALIWSNASDLLVGTTSTVSVVVDAGTLPLGPADVLGGVYVNSQPRLLPAFDANGDPVVASYTGWASATSTTELVPFMLTKDIAAPENELVRGVHNHRTAVSLLVENNLVGPSSAFEIVDYVPAALEFLGCGTDDNSVTVTEEYPGSGPLNATPFGPIAGCALPSSVDTQLVDPPGPQPLAVYTVVRWDTAALATIGAGTLPAGGSQTLRYVVGIPQAANDVFPGTAPTPESGEQGSNLDNNTGASTIETATEQSATNGATLTGTYVGVSYSDTDADTVTLEDLAIQKGVDTATISQGEVSTWTLDIEVSEYTTAATGIVVTDTVPDGLCPLGTASVDAECAGGPAPSLPYTSATENTDGTWTLVWALADAVADDTRAITFSTRTRTAYQEAFADETPVRAHDTWTNNVQITGTATDLTLAVRTVDDVSSADQEASGITLSKQVAAPVAGSCDDGSGLPGDGTGLTWESTSSTQFTPGDIVCWRIDTNAPTGLDTTVRILADFLPAGYTYISSTTGVGSDLTFPAPAVDGRVVTWDFGAAGVGLDQSQLARVVIASRITDPTAAESVDISGNLAKLVYQNTPESVFQLRDQADAPWREPVVTLDKSASPTTVVGGDVVTYTIAVTNSPARDVVDVEVRDLLPTQLTCADLVPGSLTPGFACTAGSPAQINGTIASLAAGATTNVTYQVLVDTRFASGENLDNHAGVRTFQTVTNDPANTRYTYVPSNNIDPSLTPNTTPADDTQRVTVQAATITKAAVTGVVEAGNTAAQATVGELVTYTVTATLPRGTTLTNATLADTLPASLALAGLASATPPTLTVDGAAPPAGVTLTAVGNTVQVTFPATYATPLGADQVVALTYTAQVLDVAAARAGQSIQNTARLQYANSLGSPVSQTASVTTPVVEPDINLAKTTTDADSTATPGETITYAVAVSNAAGTSVAHDVVVVDTLPAAFNPVNGGVLVVDGGTVGPDNGIWDLAARTITWTLASVAPGASTTLDYDIRVADPVPSPTTFTNTAVATATSLAGTVTGERAGPSAVNPNRYSATSAVTLEGPRPTLVKSVTPGSATIGEVVTFTVVASIPPSVTTYDVTVFDTLPAGLTFLDTVSATCTAPVGCAIVPVPLPAAGQRVGWFLGDLAADSLQRDITIVYRATVADVPAATAGAVLTNSAAIGSNLADEISGTPAAIPPAGDFDGTSTPATADVTVLEPRVVLTKTVAQGASQVDSRRVLPGETVTFSVTVANTGTSPAYDVVVDDVTDPRFTAVSVVAGTGWTVVDGVPTDGTLRFSVPVIPVAGSVTITYQLRVPMLTAADEVPGAELTNTADATYTSLPGVVPGERSYDDVAPDTVPLEADVASLGDTVWFDLDGNGLQGPGEPGVPGVQVTVVFAGADGVFGTADDETHPVTTAADGTYLVPNLPQGQYQVTVNPATLPAGTAVTYDQDGATGGLGTATVSLAGGEDRTDVDFGIQGTGTVGDLVWLDLNGNGTQDAGEPGLAGIGVDVTWHGPDGILGTADDITFSTVTDGTGAWTVVGVPAGDLTVALDPTTFPAGLAPVSDPDGGTADGSAAGSLGAGATDLTYDFGLSGTGLIGDRLWVDLDSNGLQDLGEPGIPGATVEVRWYGLDGVVGTADDAVVTVTTGDDGLYGVGSLPPGEYDVTVTVLPAALAPTFDEDFGTVGPNGATTLTLGDGEQHRSADFGFVSTTGVGDLVWLDLNGNGSQDAGEPGLPGVEITVTSAGLDGALGTSDDIVVTTTTGPDGAWLVTGLPAGLTQVEVTGTLPDGVVPSYDFDGTGTPGVSEVSLLDNTTDRTQDFGYVGANSIGDRAWVDLNLDGVQDAVEPGLGGLTVEVTWLGADGVLGGGDDLVIQTVTAGDGGYLVPGLPDGDYTVAVVAGVPAGYAPSWDEIGAADGASVVTGLGSDGPEDHSTADFGYGGTGALGGTVWLDRNADGVLDSPAEAGLPGIGIDVTWAGPDGVLGTPDDVVIHVVTGPNGVWLVEGMPPGPFIAAVDLTTLPPGTSVVFDRESGLVSPDGTLTGSLAAGERRLDVDTGVRGTAAIGDLVWVDVNRNDTLDPGEPGAADVRVVVTWHGPDGVLGGGDDVTVEVRTNPSGVYLVDGLPGGEYTVAFDGTTLPAGTVAYSDLDGGDPLVTTVTLAIGQVRGGVDLVLRIRSILAATGAAVGLLALLSLLLVGSGALLRRRAARAAR